MEQLEMDGIVQELSREFVANREKEEQRAYAREWYSKNAKKVNAKIAKYRKLNHERKAAWQAVRRLRLFGFTQQGKITEATKHVKMLKSADSAVCPYCNREFPVGQLTVDHIIPLSRGGQHIPENLTLACRPCNFSKGSRMLMTADGKLPTRRGAKVEWE